jgi:hypothetical protein
MPKLIEQRFRLARSGEDLSVIKNLVLFINIENLDSYLYCYDHSGAFTSDGEESAMTQRSSCTVNRKSFDTSRKR